MPSWHLITGEYPPALGGVADYSRIVACALASEGDRVLVTAPFSVANRMVDRGVDVRRLEDHFGIRGLAQLEHLLRAQRGDRILVQYVPHAFGMKAMNLPFCFWLYRQRRRDITVMFHEVAFPFRDGQALSHRALAAMQRAMAFVMVRAATRIFVATPAWERMLRPLLPTSRRILWLPVPSNVPVVDDRVATGMLRARYTSPDTLVVGHFGTYGESVATLLAKSLPRVMHEVPEAVAFLLGRRSDEFCNAMVHDDPALARRVHAFSELPVDQLSRYLSACDQMIQNYPDGISTRRTTAMAVLAHGVPMVTTTGHLTEPIWAKSSAVRMARSGDADGLAALAINLARDADARAHLGCAARKFYDDHFALSHTIAALRGA
jgi:glycosyltransferase involved in cell wall biosynthesis